jgi:hypothetical protein
MKILKISNMTQKILVGEKFKKASLQSLAISYTLIVPFD